MLTLSFVVLAPPEALYFMFSAWVPRMLMINVKHFCVSVSKNVVFSLVE